MPFRYSLGVKSILNQLKRKGWFHPQFSEYKPKPGDLIFFWRVSPDSYTGHIGIVHRLEDGILYTIEGNLNNKVQSFGYSFNRLDKCLGYAHVPDQ